MNTKPNNNNNNNNNKHIYEAPCMPTEGCRGAQYYSAVLWNELPVSLQEINSLSVFKNKLKQYLLLL